MGVTSAIIQAFALRGGIAVILLLVAAPAFLDFHTLDLRPAVPCAGSQA